ncbi:MULTISPECIES: 30S ribosomal protein S12 methylthiotransferase RimO [unclassified Lentimicrobium]|uniref:30S ribosomal protein S12 methylthiotransferase RimO n=1 Tax=unclassified Lentimicrobium TaxID=2677434 RepID=UPI00155232A0|nr:MULTISPECIES: 30S ribosomal protein S12 methylthiotransferase RimO [unclassified Lentimicrobium]NPD46538.1 30S ribosomal protein S12 methylthiotransferase RimO [Lentimicrobium sp. S6]NPD85187.1 30S ribosomal protein S12 methylthiotransferase RimO [Lentimicrobium sp. L6]
MKTKQIPKKINVITMGCSKNLVDSEHLMAQLKANKIQVMHEQDNEDYDAVIINTCGFIADAKEESIDMILNAVDAKRAGHLDKVYVMGCLSERYKNELPSEITEVDGYYGATDADIKKITEGIGVEYRDELVGERELTTPSHYAYLKISEGCNRTCAFCAIPKIRGKHKSIDMDILVKEARSIAAKGVKELILIAQDLVSYGIDIYKRLALAELLRELVKIKGIEWIRLHYTYPNNFPLDVLELMNSEKKIANYVDIPLQHINDRVLRDMKRNHNSETTRGLVNKMRETVPGVAIRTTLIVGFPGETEEEFQELKEFVKDSRFDRMGVFTYSPEENTTAYDLKDDVPEAVKLERKEELMQLQQGISLEINQNKLGKTYKVIIDRIEDEHYVGRTEFDSPEVDNEVLIEYDSCDLQVGKFYQAKITQVDSFDLYAQIV